jgi:hypothetical protein
MLRAKENTPKPTDKICKARDLVFVDLIGMAASSLIFHGDILLSRVGKIHRKGRKI